MAAVPDIEDPELPPEGTQLGNARTDVGVSLVAGLEVTLVAHVQPGEDLQPRPFPGLGPV